MDMKYSIQDAVALLVKGEKGVVVAAPSKEGPISGRFNARESKEPEDIKNEKTVMV